MNYPLKGLYAITDNKLIQRDRFIETVEKAVRGGAKIIQLREKDTPLKEVIKLGGRLLEISRNYRVPLIINDSPELAKEIGADGVHLGKDDQGIFEARRLLGSKAIVGISCYGEIERGLWAEREGADYVAFATPFFTPTKPERKPTPFEILREAKRRITQIPVFAIGGINKENAPSVLETGVDGIAVIAYIFGSPEPEKAARCLASLFEK